MSYFNEREQGRKAFTFDALTARYADAVDALPVGGTQAPASIAAFTTEAREMGKAGEFATFMRWYDAVGRYLDTEPDETPAAETLSPGFQRALDRVRQMERDREKHAMN